MENANALERTVVESDEQRTHMGDSLGKLVWIFFVMSFAGLVGETIQHYVAFGEWQNRAGFIWGPLSPIYGLAAALLTVILEPFQKRNTILIIVIGGIVGGAIEYFASWAMETYWGVVAWSYLTIPFNFDGRTDLFHMLIWGCLGAIWVKIGLPLCQKVFDRINLKGAIYRIATTLLTVFLICDIIMTIAVLLRADDRVHGIPAQNAFEQYCDDAYPTEMLQKRFQNMGGLGLK